MTSTASPLIRRVYQYIKTRRWHAKDNKFTHIGPYYLATGYQKLIPALPPNVKVRHDPIRIGSKFSKGIDSRLLLLAARVTRLIKLERCEFSYHQATEVQGYVERLLVEAIRYGECHEPTMDLVKFWVREPQLVHKVFKVLAPRYKNYTTSFTSLYQLAPKYSESVNPGRNLQVYQPGGLLELKGNPFPSLRPQQPRSKFYLTNILLDAAKKDKEWNVQVQQLNKQAADAVDTTTN